MNERSIKNKKLGSIEHMNFGIKEMNYHWTRILKLLR